MLRFQDWNLTSPFWKTPIWLTFSWLEYNITSQHPLRRKRWWQQEGLSSKKTGNYWKLLNNGSCIVSIALAGDETDWNSWLPMKQHHAVPNWLHGWWSVEFWLAHFECGRQGRSNQISIFFLIFIFLIEHPFLNIIYGMFARLTCEIPNRNVKHSGMSG